MFILLLPVIVSIILGYALNKMGFLDESLIDGIKKLVINICLPAMLLSSLMMMEFQTKYVLVFIAMFIACGLLLVIASGIKAIFKIKSLYFPFLVTGFEAGMLGYALYTSIYGSAANFAVIDVGQVLFVFIILVPMVIMAKENGVGDSKIVKTSVLTAFKSPVIWSILLGILLSITMKDSLLNSEVFIAITGVLRFIAAPTLFLICLIIGSGLIFSFKGLKDEMMTCFIRLGLCIAIAFAIKFLVLEPLGLVDQLWTALLFMFVLPGPFVIPAFMKNPSMEDKNYVSNTLSIGTFISLLAVSLIVIVS